MLSKSNFSFSSTNIRKSPKYKGGRGITHHPKLDSKFCRFLWHILYEWTSKTKNIFVSKICLLLCNTTVNYQVSARIIYLALPGKSCSSIVTFAPGKYDVWQLSMTESLNSLIAAKLSVYFRRLREFLSLKRM